MAIIPPMKNPIAWNAHNCSSSFGWIQLPLLWEDDDAEDFSNAFDNKQQKICIGNAEGYKCTDCDCFYPMSELNQPEGSNEFTTFRCYGCRKGLKSIF